MPLRRYNPEVDPTKNLNFGVNPYLSRLQELKSEPSSPILYGEELSQMSGKWASYFENHGANIRGLIVEIGCHMGHILVEMATSKPDFGFVGMDITLKRAVSTTEKISKNKLTNAVCVFANASGLDRLFANEELDGTVIFFPDPWPKRKHAKNRLVTTNFCEQLKSKTKPGGFVWLKTDQMSYFEQAEMAFQSAGFLAHPSPPSIFERVTLETPFQKLFVSSGLSFKEGYWTLPFQTR